MRAKIALALIAVVFLGIFAIAGSETTREGLWKKSHSSTTRKITLMEMLTEEQSLAEQAVTLF